MSTNASLTCFRESQLSSSFFHTPYHSMVNDSLVSTTVWSPFQAPVPVENLQKSWSNENTVKLTRNIMDWNIKRVTMTSSIFPCTLPRAEISDDPPTIILEPSDCSVCTPIFDDSNT